MSERNFIRRPEEPFVDQIEQFLDNSLQKNAKKTATLICDFLEIISKSSSKDIQEKIEDKVFSQSIDFFVTDQYFEQFKRELFKELYNKIKNSTHIKNYKHYVDNFEKIFKHNQDNNNFEKLKEALDGLEKQAAAKAFRKILASPSESNKFSSIEHIPDKHFEQFVKEMWRVMSNSVESKQDYNSIFKINEKAFFLILEKLHDDDKKMSLTLLFFIHNYPFPKEIELREKFNSAALQSILKNINDKFGERIKSALPNHQIQDGDPFSVIEAFAKYYHEYEHIKGCDLDKRTPVSIQQKLKSFAVNLDTASLDGLPKGAEYWQREKVKQMVEDSYQPSIFCALSNSREGYLYQNTSWFYRNLKIEKDSQLCKFYASLLDKNSKTHKLELKHKAIIAYALLSQPKSDFHKNVLHNLQKFTFGSSEPTLSEAKAYFKQIVIDLYKINEHSEDGKITLNRIEDRVAKINRLAENKEWRWNSLFSNPASEITKEFFGPIDKPIPKEKANNKPWSIFRLFGNG